MYYRRYTAEHLCKTCLRETTFQRVRRAINKRKMFRETDRIAVGISGGKDSAVLLDILFRLEANYPDATLIPIIVDEGIKGYRDKALQAARQLTDSLGFELVVKSFKDLFGYSLDEIIQKKGVSNSLGACSYCGVFRRRALNRAAQEVKADVVATGHILDDEAQTIMMNMMRGDSRRIARTNRSRNHPIEGFVPRVKPLIEITERDVIAYAYHNELPYHDVPCPYANEAYRNDIRVFLNSMEFKRPGTLLAIMRSGDEIIRAFEQTASKTQINYCSICGEVTSGRICKACSILADLED